MAEEKVMKDNTKELQAQIENLQGDLQKAYEIANAYIKAYNNLLGSVNMTVQTNLEISATLQEKLK
jgi:hypothetical protein